MEGEPFNYRPADAEKPADLSLKQEQKEDSKERVEKELIPILREELEGADKLIPRVQEELEKMSKEAPYKLGFLAEDLREFNSLKSKIEMVEREILRFGQEYGADGLEEKRKTLVLAKKSSGFWSSFRKKTTEERAARESLKENYGLTIKDISAELKKTEEELRILTQAGEQKKELTKKLLSFKESLFSNFIFLRNINRQEKLKVQEETSSQIEAKKEFKSTVSQRQKPSKEETEAFFEAQQKAQEEIHFRDEKPKISKETTEEFFRKQIEAQEAIHFRTETEGEERPMVEMEYIQRANDQIKQAFSNFLRTRNYSTLEGESARILRNISFTPREKWFLKEWFKRQIVNADRAGQLRTGEKPKLENLMEAFFK